MTTTIDRTEARTERQHLEQAVLAATRFMHQQAQLGHDITSALAAVMERQEHLDQHDARHCHPAFKGVQS